MPADREQLAKAMVAAADLEFSQFKDAIQDTVEQRFKDRIGEIAQDRATKLFNPDAEVEIEDDDLDPQDPEFVDPDLDDPLDEPDPNDPPEDPEDPPADPDDPPADPDPVDPPADPVDPPADPADPEPED